MPVMLREVGRTMSPRDKIERWIEESSYNQTRLAREAGIPPSKMSEIMNGKTPVTINWGQPLSIAMDVSLDWLYDEGASWPPVKRYGGGERPLSQAERDLLKTAHLVVEKGPPEERDSMALAHRRLLGLDDRMAGQVPLEARGEAPVNRAGSGEQKRRGRA